MPTFYFFNIYLFNFIFLFFIFLAASGLSCGMQDLHWGTQDLFCCCQHSAFSLVVARGLCSLRHTGSLIEVQELSSCGAHGLSCPSACGILVPWPRIEPASPALEGRFFTTGPPGKSAVPTLKIRAAGSATMLKWRKILITVISFHIQS